MLQANTSMIVLGKKNEIAAQSFLWLYDTNMSFHIELAEISFGTVYFVFWGGLQFIIILGEYRYRQSPWSVMLFGLRHQATWWTSDCLCMYLFWLLRPCFFHLFHLSFTTQPLCSFLDSPNSPHCLNALHTFRLNGWTGLFTAVPDLVWRPYMVMQALCKHPPSRYFFVGFTTAFLSTRAWCQYKHIKWHKICVVYQMSSWYLSQYSYIFLDFCLKTVTLEIYSYCLTVNCILHGFEHFFVCLLWCNLFFVFVCLLLSYCHARHAFSLGLYTVPEV